MQYVHLGVMADGAVDQGKLQALEMENRVLQERLAQAESALQLARSQAEELAEASAQEVTQLQNKLAHHQVGKIQV